MSVQEALEILKRGVPSTLRDDNLSYEQVELRNAYRVIEEFVHLVEMREGFEELTKLLTPREFDS